MLNKIQRKRRIKLVQGKPNIKVGSMWLKTLLFGILIFLLTVFFSYRVFDGANSFHYLLTINEQNDQISEYKDKIQKLKLDLQLIEVAVSKKDDELKKLKEENNDLQEEILFYEKIVGKRR
jgi:peptidoglycan hydrolase CwlO-like protein